MKQQNFKSHRQWVLGYHFITFLAILALIVGSIRNLFYYSEENMYAGSLIVLISFILLFIFYFVRSFALRAQDRAIKAEENFRHYLLTGKPISNGLTMRQIIGLRFASDKEFTALAEKAEKENLSEDAIKKSIIDWKPDMYRV
tara:strand:- start:16442 stop:16870 length:429 start_codon:yes stop_codon:yes gene_type:complete